MIGTYAPYDLPTYSGSIYVEQSMYVDGVLYDTVTGYTSSNDTVILEVSNSAFNTGDLSWDSISVIANVYQDVPQPTPTPTPTLTPTPTPSNLPVNPVFDPTWYYRSDQPGGAPNTQWQDTYANGPNVNISIIDVNHVTNRTLGAYTGDWYETDPRDPSPNRPMVFNASSTGQGITGSNFTIQGWYYINEFLSIDGDPSASAFFNYRGGELVEGDTMFEIGVGSRPSGSEQVIYLAGRTPNGVVLQEFPEETLQTGSWYQISLVRSGSTFADHTLYVDKGVGHSPTASNAIHISGSSAEIYGNHWNDSSVLSGSMANLILYDNTSLTENQVDANYDRINNYLSL